jgi:hypothetical protein
MFPRRLNMDGSSLGIVFGTGTVWWLLTRKDKAEVVKDWHFWTKLASNGLS